MVLFLYLEGATCDVCHGFFTQTWNVPLVVDLSQLIDEGHFIFAHISLDHDHTKSKFRGKFSSPTFLEKYARRGINRQMGEEQRRKLWVHEKNARGEHVFSYRVRFTNNSKNPNDLYCGVFIADGKRWLQKGIEAWFTMEGRLRSFFPSGWGHNGRQKRRWERVRQPWADDPRSPMCRSIRRSKFILLMHVVVCLYFGGSLFIFCNDVIWGYPHSSQSTVPDLFLM